MLSNDNIISCLINVIFFLFLFCSLINNSLTINSGGRSPATRRAESRVRSAQRRLIAPPALNFDENSNSPVKSTMSPEDVSFYAGNSPQGSPRPCSISPCMDIGILSPGLRETETMDDYNSRDSGYGAPQRSRKLFNFVEPSGLAPKRIDTPSPPKSLTKRSPTSTSCFRSFNSLSSDSMESMDDDCMGLLDMEEEDMDDNAQLPASFNTIINGSIKSTNGTRLPLLRRCLSLTDSNVNRAKHSLFEPKTPEMLKIIAEAASPFQSKITDSGSKAFKRPEPPSFGSPVQSKRYKTDDKENMNDIPIVRPAFRKSQSMNEELIKDALARCKYLNDHILIIK